MNQYESRITGEIFPGVTTVGNVIAKEALYGWYGRHGTKKCKEILEESQKFGSRIHTIIQASVSGQELKLSKDEALILANFRKQMETEVKEILWFEKDFVHEELKFGGTADGAYTDLKGQKVLMDIKTSSSVWPEQAIQLSAYREGLLEDYKEKFDYVTIWHLDKKSLSWEVLKINTSGLFDVFKACITIWRWKNNRQ